MAERDITLILRVKDLATKGLDSFKSSLKGAGREAKRLLENSLVQGIGFAGLIRGLGAAFDAADRLEASIRKLEGTAKITGVPLSTLAGIADEAQQKFQLSAVQANDFAVEMAKLAVKAGDVGKAGPALAAFLEIGAAKGLTASETLKAVQQSILGIDEGTDKLFNANPSVLFEEFAAAIGKSPGKLSDTEKAQALLTRALQDGQKVTGSFTDFLASAAGQQELLKIKTEQAAATLGQAMADVRTAVIPALAFLADGFRMFIGGIQLLANDLGGVFESIVPFWQRVGGNLLLSMSETLGQSRLLLFIFGDSLVQFADEAGNTGIKMVTDANRSLAAISARREAAAFEIVGIETRGQQGMTDAAAQGGHQRITLTEEERKAREKAAADTAKTLAGLNEELGTLLIQLERKVSADRAKELANRQKDLGTFVAGEAKSITEAYQEIDQANLLLASGFDKAQKPVITLGTTFRALSGIELPDLVDGFDKLATTSGKTREEVVKLTQKGKTFLSFLDDWVDTTEGASDETETLGSTLEKSARSAIDMGGALGLISTAGQSTLNTIVNLGASIAQTFTGAMSVQGVIGIISGVSSLVKGFFGGKSPAQKSAEEALKKNTTRLEDLTRLQGDVLRLSTAGGKLATAEDVLSRFLVGLNANAGASKNRTIALGGQLAKQGLGIGDLDAIAKDLGLTIRDKDGNLRFELLGQLLQGLRSIEPTQFADTFTGQRESLQREASLFDLSDTEQARRLAALAGGSLGSATLGARLGGIDFATEEGRQAGLAAIRQLFLDLPTLSARDLGGLSGEDFLDVLEDLKGLLEESVGAADEPVATASDPLPVDVSAGITPPMAMPPLSEAAMTGLTQADAFPQSSLAEFRAMNATLSDIRSLLADPRSGPLVSIGAITVEGSGARGLDLTTDALAESISARLAIELLRARQASGVARVLQ